MSTEAPAATVFELGALFALEGAHARVIRRVVADYRALTGGPPSEAELDRAARWTASPRERALAILVARAGGVAAAVSRSRVARLTAEHLYGAQLYEAISGVPARDAHGDGVLGGVALRADARARLEAAAPGPRVLIGRLPIPALLYLLARHGLTEIFDQVVGTSLEADAPRDLGPLVVEAERRVGPIAEVVVADLADAASLVSGGSPAGAVRTVPEAPGTAPPAGG